MRTSPAAVTRAGLVLVATGILSFVSARDYLDNDVAIAIDLTFGFAAFFALVLLASARTPPRWTAVFALALTALAYVWGTVLVDGQHYAALALLAVMALAFVVAQPAYRPLVVAGFALWTPALWLFVGRRSFTGIEPVVALSAWGALAFLVATTLARVGTAEARLRRVGLAVLAVTIVSAVFERHTVVASRVFAPDDAMAVIGVVALAVLALTRLPTRIVDAFASGIALAAYVLVAMALLVGKGYHVDAVVSPHYAAILLLEGKDPYVSFDMTEALAHFGLPPTLATRLEDGTYLHSHNYPAGALLLAVPFVALGVGDMRWVYLGEMLLMALLLIGRARVPWRPLVAALLVGSTVLTRQYVLAGIDPTWALGVSVAWLYLDRRWLSPVALGLACASRQPAWFFVPFYLLEILHERGWRAALGRGLVIGAAFLIPNLPFIVDAPAAWMTSVLTPMVGSLEPYGVGLVRLGVLHAMPLLPHAVYTALAVAVFAVLVFVLWRFFRRLPGAPLTFPLVPVFFSWRSLQNYFVFAPLLTIVHDEDLLRASSPDAETEPVAAVPAVTPPRESARGPTPSGA